MKPAKLAVDSRDSKPVPPRFVAAVVKMTGGSRTRSRDRFYAFISLNFY